MSAIYDLLERIMSVGDKHDVEMAKIADEDLDKMETELAAMRDQIAALQTEKFELKQRVAEVMDNMTDWRDKAYSLDIFPEPDLHKAKELLERGGVSMSLVSASMMRHVVKSVCDMLDKALKGEAK